MDMLDTNNSTEAITLFLTERLHKETGMNVVLLSPGKLPEDCEENRLKNCLGILLYENPLERKLAMRGENIPSLYPLGFILKYILTPFDKEGNSSTPEAHMILSQAAMVLHQINFLTMQLPDFNDGIRAEDLRIKLDGTCSDILAREFRCPNTRFRFSLGFHIRPVLVAGSGVEHSDRAAVEVGERNFSNEAKANTRKGRAPLRYPRITSVSVPLLQAGEGFFISGEKLNSENFAIFLGDHEIDIVDRSYELLSCYLPPSSERAISPGSYQITGRENRPDNKTLLWGGITAQLVPTIHDVSATFRRTSGEAVTGRVNILGNALGDRDDEIVVGLYREERMAATWYEVQIDRPQQTLSIEVGREHQLSMGIYQVVLRVNGEYAIDKPQISWGVE